MNSWIPWLMSDEMLGVALLILGILVLRAVFGKFISQRLKYALWLIVLLRLMMPFLGVLGGISGINPVPETLRVQRIGENLAGRYIASERQNFTVDPVTGEPQVNGNMVNEDGQNNAFVQSVEETAPENGRAFPIKQVGRVTLAVFFLATNLWFYGRLRRERTLIHKATVSVYRSELVGSPFVFGCAIYMTEASLKNEKYVLAHERTHIRHGDPLWNVLRCLCLVLYWYHPLVWAAAILSQRDAELACDEGTIAGLGQDERKPYATALLDILTERRRKNTMLCITPMTASKSEIKNRILMITNGKRHSILLAVLVCLLAFALTACTAPASEATLAESEAADSSDSPAIKCLKAMMECPNEELFAATSPLVIGLDMDQEAQEALEKENAERIAAQEAADEVWKEQLGDYFLEGDFELFMDHWQRFEFHTAAMMNSLTISIKDIQEGEVKERIQHFDVTLELTGENGVSKECVTHWRVIYLDDSLDMIYKIELMDEGDFTQLLQEF